MHIARYSSRGFVLNSPPNLSCLVHVYVTAGPAACVVLRLLTSLLDKRKKDASVHLLTELEVSVLKWIICVFEPWNVVY